MSKAVALVLALAAVGSARWIQPVWNNWNWDGLNTLPVRALPTVFSSPSVAVAPAAWTGHAPAFSASQYHAQDELGQASFGYSHPGQAASNFRDAFGNQAGSWSYIDSEGKPVVVNYIADANGFRVVSNNLPVAPAADMILPQPVVDTPEVAEAKAAHMAALRAAEANNGAVAVPLNLPMPVQVEDTPEVAAAKAEHLRVWTEAKMRAEQA